MRSAAQVLIDNGYSFYMRGPYLMYMNNGNSYIATEVYSTELTNRIVEQSKYGYYYLSDDYKNSTLNLKGSMPEIRQQEQGIILHHDVNFVHYDSDALNTIELEKFYRLKKPEYWKELVEYVVGFEHLIEAAIARWPKLFEQKV